MVLKAKIFWTYLEVGVFAEKEFKLRLFCEEKLIVTFFTQSRNSKRVFTEIFKNVNLHKLVKEQILTVLSYIITIITTLFLINIISFSIQLCILV